MRLAGIEVAEAHRHEGDADVCRSAIHRMRRMQHKLPEALIEQQARREISAEQRGSETKRQRLPQPARVDDLERRVGRASSWLTRSACRLFGHADFPSSAAARAIKTAA